MIDFETNEDRKRDLEAAVFLIVVYVLGFLALFSCIVVQVYKWCCQ